MLVRGGAQRPSLEAAEAPSDRCRRTLSRACRDSGTHLAAAGEVVALEVQQVQRDGHHEAAEQVEGDHPERHDLDHQLAAPGYRQEPPLRPVRRGSRLLLGKGWE